MKNKFWRIACFSTLVMLLVIVAALMSGCECAHYYDDPILLKVPTCLENGLQKRMCIRCYEYIEEVIPRDEKYHNPVETSSVAPTCTEDGVTYYACSYCGDEFYKNVYSTGHSYTATSSVPPTCTEDGSEQVTCSACGDTDIKTLPATGHKSVLTLAVEPTCKSTGMSAGTKCETCNTQLSGGETLSIVDHNYENSACIWCATLKKYTVNYVCDSGVTFPGQTYSHGDTISLPDTEVLEDEYTAFVGWFTEDGTEYTATSTVTGDITLHAKLDSYIPISDLSGLLSMAASPDKNYRLTGNIDAEGVIWTPIDTFSGTLNGNGYAIYNIVLNTTEQKDFGFIRVNNGTVKNLDLKDFTFNATYTPGGTYHFGVISGQNNGTISDVSLYSGTVMFSASRSVDDTSYYSTFGIIAGINNAGGVISECTVKVDAEFSVSAHNSEGNGVSSANHMAYYYLSCVVGQNKASVRDILYEGKIKLTSKTTSTGSWDNDHYAQIFAYLGSIVGTNSGGSVLRASAKAEMDIITSSIRSDCRNFIYSGLLAGTNSGEGVIEFSYAGGDIYSTSSYLSYIGGFIGFNEANSSVKSCYTTAYSQAAGGAYIGGFAGANSGIVQNSYAAGEVLAEGSGRTGGFVGSLNSSGTISKCYSTGDVATAGGSVGHFLGYAEGAVLKCYFMDSSTVMSGGTYLPTVTEYNTIEGIIYTKLWNEDFLINEMYWEDYGWTVVADENPLLTWEIEVNHSFVTTVIEPTCERGGFTIYNCTDCSRLFIKDYKDPTGHKTEEIATVPPTCGASGYTLIKCTADGCSHEEKINITEKLAHAEASLSAVYELAPTCTTPGKTIYYCSDCKSGDIVVDHEALGHLGTYLSTLEEATCTSEGEDKYFCSRVENGDVCGEYTVVTQPLSHTPVSVPYLAPSCGRHIDESGSSTYTPEDGHMPGEMCSVCNRILSGCEVIPAHTFALAETVSAPDCLNEGIGRYVCSECEYSENRAIAPNGHTDSDLNNICNVCKKFTFNTDVPESLFVHIDSAEKFDAIRNNLGGYYILDADIDLTGYSWTPIGTENTPFKGVLYGAGHTVKGLSLTADEKTTVQGLFGYNKGVIANLKVESICVSVSNSNAIVGGIAAYNMGDVIACSITGDSTFSLSLSLDVNDYTHHSLGLNMAVGGIVGINDQTGRMEYCKSEGHVGAVMESLTKISSSDAVTAIMALIYNTKAESSLNISFAAIVGRNEGLVDRAEVKERVGVTMSFVAELVNQKGRINAAFNVYAADIVGYNSGTVSASVGKGAAYCYSEGYNYKNAVDKFLKGKLCEITVTFVNHSEDSAYAGLIGGNEGIVIN